MDTIKNTHPSRGRTHEKGALKTSRRFLKNRIIKRKIQLVFHSWIPKGRERGEKKKKKET